MSKESHNNLKGEQKVISIKEARKLLGKKFSSVSDEEIDEMIQVLSLIARAAVTPEFSSI